MLVYLKTPDSKTSDSTHPVGLIHRLVVETGADDVKRRHGDGHSHSADHGGYQSGEPAVRTEPLPEKKTQLFSMCCTKVSHFSRTWEPDTQSLAEEKVASCVADPTITRGTAPLTPLQRPTNPSLL